VPGSDSEERESRFGACLRNVKVNLSVSEGRESSLEACPKDVEVLTVYRQRYRLRLCYLLEERNKE
jgi:hypothetical protein